MAEGVHTYKWPRPSLAVDAVIVAAPEGGSSAQLLLPFGMVLYELLHRKMVVADLMYLGSAAEAEAFAFKVAAGYRVPIDEELPGCLRCLISDCLAGDCDLRPSMAEVVRRLEEVRQSGELQQHEHRHGPASAAGCCTVM